MTDNDPPSPAFQKTPFSEMVEFCGDADLLIHDAQFTQEEWENRRDWGHSSIDAALNLALEAGVKRFFLFHHDPQRTDKELDEMLRDSRRVTREKNSKMRIGKKSTVNTIITLILNCFPFLNNNIYFTPIFLFFAYTLYHINVSEL